jgi:hypothetical protein
MTTVRRYRYVGPAELLPTQPCQLGAPIGSSAERDQWITNQDSRDLDEPFTFIVDLNGTLHLAPRRTEHVQLANGQDVLAAGEVQFTQHGSRWVVQEISNQSTGYCPDIDCWPAVSAALDAAGVGRPDRFTGPIVFRRCSRCQERNIVQDEVFVCAMCDAALPDRWNF